MKIAYFVCSRFFGGVEKVVCDSINALSLQHETLLIAPKECEFMDKISQKVQIYEYKNYDKRWNLFLYFEIYKILSKFGTQILHSHGAKATQMAFILSKFMDFRLVATKHNARKGKIFERIKNCLCVSKIVQKTIKNESKVLYFGIKPQNVKKANLTKNPFIITAIGRLDPIKGFDELIKVCVNLKFDFILQIVGSGDELENLQNLAKNLGISKKVKFLGFSDEIAQILANSHLQVISSKNEGMLIVLLEGLFYSSVILSTRVGIADEILSEEFLVDYENLESKINKIYANYDEFKVKFENLALQKREKFSLDNYVLNLQNYYKEILCKP